MISQKCPRCRSPKVRLGYRPTRWWSILVARYNLLCDNCNWEFVGFAVPGTTAQKRKSNIKKSSEVSGENEDSSDTAAKEKASGTKKPVPIEVKAPEEEKRSSERSGAAMLS
jgi:hypothetical protein